MQSTKSFFDYLDSEDRGEQYLPKRRYIFNNQHGVVSQNVWNFNNYFTDKYLGPDMQRVEK
jgi:hypothetical protein